MGLIVTLLYNNVLNLTIMSQQAYSFFLKQIIFIEKEFSFYYKLNLMLGRHKLIHWYNQPVPVQNNIPCKIKKHIINMYLSLCFCATT